MSYLLYAAIVFTLACYVLAMALALARMVRGPSAQDRVLAMDLIWTIGMLLLLVLAIRYRNERNISRHELTTAMQHLYVSSRRHQSISGKFLLCQDQVRFFALHRIKPHAPPLVRAPVNSFEF